MRPTKPDRPPSKRLQSECVPRACSPQAPLGAPSGSLRTPKTLQSERVPGKYPSNRSRVSVPHESALPKFPSVFLQDLLRTPPKLQRECVPRKYPSNRFRASSLRTKRFSILSLRDPVHRTQVNPHWQLEPMTPGASDLKNWISEVHENIPRAARCWLTLLAQHYHWTEVIGCGLGRLAECAGRLREVMGPGG